MCVSLAWADVSVRGLTSPYPHLLASEDGDAQAIDLFAWIPNELIKSMRVSPSPARWVDGRQLDRSST